MAYARINYVYVLDHHFITSRSLENMASFNGQLSLFCYEIDKSSVHTLPVLLSYSYVILIHRSLKTG